MLNLLAGKPQMTHLTQVFVVLQKLLQLGIVLSESIDIVTLELPLPPSPGLTNSDNNKQKYVSNNVFKKYIRIKNFVKKP